MLYTKLIDLEETIYQASWHRCPRRAAPVFSYSVHAIGVDFTWVRSQNLKIMLDNENKGREFSSIQCTLRYLIGSTDPLSLQGTVAAIQVYIV